MAAVPPPPQFPPPPLPPAIEKDVRTSNAPLVVMSSVYRPAEKLHVGVFQRIVGGHACADVARGEREMNAKRSKAAEAKGFSLWRGKMPPSFELLPPGAPLEIALLPLDAISTSETLQNCLLSITNVDSSGTLYVFRRCPIGKKSRKKKGGYIVHPPKIWGPQIFLTIREVRHLVSELHETRRRGKISSPAPNSPPKKPQH